MKPVKQEHSRGCAIACVAFVLGIAYKEAVLLFHDGERRACEEANFYCPEITKVLKQRGLHHSWKQLKCDTLDKDISDNSIVFIKPTLQFAFGHFLVKTSEGWMDPWINLPKYPSQAGFRKDLPGTPEYLIYKSEAK